MPFMSSVEGVYGFRGVKQGQPVTLVNSSTAVTTYGPNNTYNGYTQIDDFSTPATINAFSMNGTSHTTVQLCTNGSIHFSVTQTGGYNNPLPCINIAGPYDRRGGYTDVTRGIKATDPNVTWTRIWITWSRFYGGTYAYSYGDLQYEIYFVRDLTASKQYIQVACFSNTYAGYSAAAHNVNLTGTLFVNIDNATVTPGQSWVWQSDLTGVPWMLYNPGSLTNFK
jgi:hypothetical protein